MLSPQHIRKSAAAALAVGAFAAPMASAAPIGGYSRQDKQLSPSTQSLPAAALPAWATSGAAAFHAVASPNSPAVTRAGQGSGFDWGDAGIGAGGGLVLSIVVIGGGLVLVQRRPRRNTTTAAATG